MAFAPEDGLFVYRTLILKLLSNPSWHPGELNSLTYGFTAGIAVSVDFLESGQGSRSDELVELVQKYSDEELHLKDLVTKANELSSKEFFKLESFTNYGYAVSKSGSYYVQGFANAHYWVMKLFSAFRSHGLSRESALSEVKKLVKEILPLVKWS